MLNSDPQIMLKNIFEAINSSLAVSSEEGLTEIGIIESLGEGIAQVSGLTEVESDELLQFKDGSAGLIYNLDEDQIGVILLGEERDIEAGEEVRRTGRRLGIPVGRDFIGRVVDPLGQPLDGKGFIKAEDYYPIERPAPGIMERESVNRPLQTGIRVIDALIPIGRGQRELILGDRQTGKTAIAVDTIINQKEGDVICIYCAIGKQRAEVNRVISDLESFSSMDHTIVVSATCSTPTGKQYISPYAAMSLAEYFMDQGDDVLVVFDDLTWHARSYRELALLLRRPPGREAYPGDIFYIHARLLERSLNRKKEAGGGSITALPIIETQSQDISAFIPTNLISITDGQIFLSPTLFQKDQLPAIDAGRSVSRVGGAAQQKIYRAFADQLRLFYSQFEELESFSRFSSRLDDDTLRQLERGKRVRELLKQSQFDVMEVADQVLLLFGAGRDLFHHIAIDHIDDISSYLINTEHEKINLLKDKIRDKGELTDEETQALASHLESVISEYGERHPEQTVNV